MNIMTCVCSVSLHLPHTSCVYLFQNSDMILIDIHTSWVGCDDAMPLLYQMMKEYQKLLSEHFGVINLFNWMLMSGWLCRRMLLQSITWWQFVAGNATALLQHCGILCRRMLQHSLTSWQTVSENATAGTCCGVCFCIFKVCLQKNLSMVCFPVFWQFLKSAIMRV